MASTPLNRPAVPAHIGTRPLHDLAGYFGPVECDTWRHNIDVVHYCGTTASGVAPAAKGGARKGVRAVIATAHGGGKQRHSGLYLWDTSHKSTCKHLDKVGCPHVTVRGWTYLGRAVEAEGFSNLGSELPGGREELAQHGHEAVNELLHQVDAPLPGLFCQSCKEIADTGCQAREWPCDVGAPGRGKDSADVLPERGCTRYNAAPEPREEGDDILPGRFQPVDDRGSDIADKIDEILEVVVMVVEPLETADNSLDPCLENALDRLPGTLYPVPR